jgi:glycosyltransferase involved in cell wall biosynthesis
LKILIISNLRPSKSGITEQVFNLKNKLTEESYNVSLVSTYGTIFGRLKGILQSFKKAVNCDLIIGTGCAFYGFLPIAVASTVAYFVSKPVLFNFHDGQAEIFLKKSEKTVRFFIRNRKVIVASEYIYNIFKAYLFNAELISNMFIFESFPFRENEFYWNKKIIWARSFESIYQPELALNIALKTLENTDCEFHFYGDGALYEGLKSKYKHPGIIYHGLVSRDQILKDLSGSSIFLNTTIYDNMPNSFFESGYYNLLVVSTKVGGIATTFNENEIAYVPENSVEAFSKLLCNIIENPVKYDAYRKNLNIKVLKFNWMNVRDKWIELLNEFNKKNQ